MKPDSRENQDILWRRATY